MGRRKAARYKRKKKISLQPGKIKYFSKKPVAENVSAITHDNSALKQEDNPEIKPDETPKPHNEIEQEEILQTPLSFARFVTKDRYLTPQHIILMNKYLIEAAMGKTNRLIINMPPRHGKSELISKYFPTWYLIRHPESRIILTSYEQKFASSWGRRVRDLLTLYGGKFGIMIRKDVKSSSEFQLEGHEGGMTCVGARGALTGKGANLLIIDDPVKNNMESGSQLIRDNVWDWFISTAYTRLEPEGVIIIVMTRWHEDDLCGRIKKSTTTASDGMSQLSAGNPGLEELPDDDRWIQISLPALAVENDILGRSEGEALWPERFPLKKILATKKALGTYWFSALYQQDPVPVDDCIFKRQNFRYFLQDNNFYFLNPNFLSSNSRELRPKKDCIIYATMDLAVSSKETADYTVIIVFAVTPTYEILILEIIREHFKASEHIRMIQSVHQKWHPTQIGIEAVQYQISLLDNARDLGLPVLKLDADKNKVSRALPIATLLEDGKVYFNREGGWLNDFENELVYFQHGKHDDQVDAFAYITYMTRHLTGCMPAGTNRESDIEN
jgi:predicted phage terminase large subunit-like protein